jgi:hypothetical protein
MNIKKTWVSSMLRTGILAGVIVANVGCAGITSTPKRHPSDGLVYYMPMKDIVVAITKKTETGKGTSSVVVVSPSPAYPDITLQYVLNFGRNIIGRNSMQVGVGASGLLTSSKSATTSGVADALKNLGTSLGSTSAKAVTVDPLSQVCEDGLHTFKFKANSLGGPACDFQVTIARINVSKKSETKKQAGTTYTGIFYRQEEPYDVNVSSPTMNGSFVVFSPSQAEVRFLPIAKTLFANNESDFGFSDGMPTKYDQNADGEIVALFKLPADVFGAYFGALGKTFEAFKTNDENQASALAAAVKLELAKEKHGKCIAAIQAKNENLIQVLECEK